MVQDLTRLYLKSSDLTLYSISQDIDLFGLYRVGWVPPEHQKPGEEH